MKIHLTLGALALAIALPATASAQALGVSVNYDTEFEDPGIGANVTFHTGGVVDNSRVAADLKYWLVGEGGDYFTGNVDGQYLWFRGPQALGYGLIGLNLSVVSFEADFVDDIVDLGINLGAGGEYTIAPNVALYGEAKLLLSLGDIDSRIIAGGGVRFYFGGGSGGELDLSDM
ncbi:MAG: hypothetical protein AAFQ82_10480 [Myxococcota bacterium]